MRLYIIILRVRQFSPFCVDLCFRRGNDFYVIELNCILCRSNMLSKPLIMPGLVLVYWPKMEL